MMMTPRPYPNRIAFYNQSTLNTAEGMTQLRAPLARTYMIVGRIMDFERARNYNREGRIDTGDGNDIILGIIESGINGDGIYNKEAP
jgi:hypothetical protein